MATPGVGAKCQALVIQATCNCQKWCLKKEVRFATVLCTMATRPRRRCRFQHYTDLCTLPPDLNYSLASTRRTQILEHLFKQEYEWERVLSERVVRIVATWFGLYPSNSACHRDKH